MEKIISRIAINYIKNSMRDSTKRTAIFKAINEGMEKEYTEENLVSLMIFSLYCLFRNSSLNCLSRENSTIIECVTEGLKREIEEHR